MGRFVFENPPSIGWGSLSQNLDLVCRNILVDGPVNMSSIALWKFVGGGGVLVLGLAMNVI